VTNLELSWQVRRLSITLLGASQAGCRGAWRLESQTKLGCGSCFRQASQLRNADPRHGRASRRDGLAAATETITLALRHDTVWGVALGVVDGSEDHLDPFWRLYVEGARRYDVVFASADAGTVSVWIPPGGMELSEEQDVAIRELVEHALGSAQATAMFELWDRFDEHHPTMSRTPT
jgi:hypothetical protein